MLILYVDILSRTPKTGIPFILEKSRISEEVVAFTEIM